jgi:predicted ATP-dependent endonuclease of OLD family
MLTQQKLETLINNISRLCSTTTNSAQLDQLNDLESLFRLVGEAAFIG